MQGFQLFRLASQLLIGVIFARWVFSRQEIGEFETLMLIGTSLSFFWVNSLLGGLLPTYPKINPDDQKKLLGQSFLLLTSCSVLICIILYFSRAVIFRSYGSEEHLTLFFIFSSYLVFTNSGWLIEYALLLRGKFKLLWLDAILFFLAQTFAAVFLPLNGGGVEGAWIGLAWFGLFRFVWAAFLVIPSFSFSINIFSTLMKAALPLAGTALIAGSIEYLNNWLVNIHLGKDQFAIYRYGARELPLSLVLITALGSAMIPALTENRSAGLKQLKESTTRLMHFLFPMSIVLMLFSKWIFGFAFGSAFIESASVFSIFLLLVIPRVLLPQAILQAAGFQKWLPLISALELIGGILLALWLIPLLGLQGGAIAVLSAFLLEKIVLISVVDVKTGIHLTSYLNLKFFGLYVALLFGAYYVTLLWLT